MGDCELVELAEQLARDCAALRASLQEFRNSPAAEIEEACGRHLAEARSLKCTIAQMAQELADSWGEAAALAPAHRRRVEDARQRARCLLVEVAKEYGEMAGHFGDVLDSIGDRLEGLQQGGRALRGYGRAARGMR